MFHITIQCQSIDTSYSKRGNVRVLPFVWSFFWHDSKDRNNIEISCLFWFCKDLENKVSCYHRSILIPILVCWAIHINFHILKHVTCRETIKLTNVFFLLWDRHKSEYHQASKIIYANFSHIVFCSEYIKSRNTPTLRLPPSPNTNNHSGQNQWTFSLFCTQFWDIISKFQFCSFNNVKQTCTLYKQKGGELKQSTFHDMNLHFEPKVLRSFYVSQSVIISIQSC